MPTGTKQSGVFRFGSFRSCERCFSSIELLRGEGVFTENTIQVMEGPHTGGGSLNFLKRPPFHLAMVRHAKRSIFKFKD